MFGSIRRLAAEGLQWLADLFRPRVELPGQWWRLVWGERFQTPRRGAGKIGGRVVEMGECDSLDGALDLLRSTGRREWELHGRKGFILMLWPDGTVVDHSPSPWPADLCDALSGSASSVN